MLRAHGRGQPVVHLLGDHVSLRGRGVIDGTGSPTHGRYLVLVRGSDRVTIRNVKLFSHRANGDGIDLCNCRDATVDGCFVRTLDDCIVVKADQGQGPVRHVDVRRCVLWNQVVHALSVGPSCGSRWTT